MKSFKITDKIEFVCEYKKTRRGFKHEAKLYIDGIEIDKTKVCYLNRTWESYEYQTALIKLIEKTKALNEHEKKICLEYAKKNRTDWSQFKATEMVALMGDLLYKDKKESNEWKTRMLKAGLEKEGLQFPENWDSLDEDTKKARLDLVINHLGEKNEM